MKKLFVLLMTAALSVGAADVAPTAANTIALQIPDEGYNYGYAAGERYAATNPTIKQLCNEWHRALDNVAFYESINETGRAEWWQGYADGLHYFDNNSSCPDPYAPCACY